jgi:hypothetical protein
MRTESLLAGLLGLAVAAPVAAQDGDFLFADDVAVAVHGDLHVGFTHEVEADGDPDRRPGSANGVRGRFRLAPELWVDEYLQIRTGLQVDSVWGAGGSPGLPQAEAPAATLDVMQFDMRWHTPVGVWTLGRSRWHWGLGLFEHDGRVDLDRYGVPTGTGAQDQLTLEVAPFGAARPWRLLALVRQWYAGEAAGLPWVDDAWSVGLGMTGTPGLSRLGVLLRYDTHGDAGTQLAWLDAYVDARLGPAALAAEVAGRYGTTVAWTRIDAMTRRAAREDTEWLGWGGVVRLGFPGWEAGPVAFDTTGFEAGYLSGDTLTGAFGDARWSQLGADADYRVGMLLLPQMLPVRRAALTASVAADWAAFAGLDPAVLDREMASRSGGGMAGVWYVQPGFGLRSQDDLRFRLNVLYARASREMSTLQVTDTRSTAERIDDVRGSGAEVGFEVDTHLSYPLWGRVYGVLEAGVAFPGNAFKNAAGRSAPTAFAVSPRLTVLF